MKKLELSKDFVLPLNAVTERLAFMGQSGSGKTYAAMRLAELMLDAGAQIIALDPMGVWWGLLAGADGKSAGYPIHVFGGEHSHVPLVPESGALVAEVLVSKGISAVLDVSDFTISDMVMFTSGFAERFYDLKKRNKGPVHLFLEEAHNFLPQTLPAESRGGDPRRNPAVMLNRWERIVRQGRTHGIGCSLISQQPQAVNKKGLNQVSCLFAGRTLGSHERKAIGAWMDDKATSKDQLGLEDKLPSLDTGMAWVASPSWLKALCLIRVSKKTTFDSSKTPEFGVKTTEPKTLAPVDVENLRQAMSQVVDHVEKTDPKALRRRVAELEAQLAKKAPPPAAKVEVKVKEVPIIKEADLKRIDKAATVLANASGLIAALLLEVKTELGKRAPTAQVRTPMAPIRAVRQYAPLPPEALPGDTVDLGAGERRMLDAVGLRHPEPVTRDQLGILSGYSASGGTFRTYLPRLVRSGLVVERGNGIELTEAGVAAAAAAVGRAPRTTDELLNLWRQSLDGGPRKMLDVLVQAYPDPMSRGALGAMSGYAEGGGTFRTYLPKLKRLGLVVAVGDEIQASPTLFPTGKAA